MEKRIVATIFVVAVIAAVACKKDSASSSASSEALGECKFVIDQAKCIGGGKAAFCAMNHDGAMKTAWQTFTCPDCKVGDKVSCSEFTVGEACDMLATTSNQCTKDKKGEYSCDLDTHKWKLQQCAHGCEGDMQKGISCSR